MFFTDKFIVDDREPIEIFRSHQNDVTVGLLLPKLGFTIDVGILLLMQSILSAVLAAIAYYGIIQKKTGSSTKSTSFILGYGIIVPITLLAPFYMINIMDIRNRCFRMGFMPLSILTSLRTMEAMHGYAPAFATVSLRNYMLYWGALLELKWDEKKERPLRSTWQTVMEKAKVFIAHIFAISIIFSWLVPKHFEPLTENFDAIDLHPTFEPRQLVNNFVAAVLLSLTLSYSLHGVALFPQLALGCENQDVVDNPMFNSSSPSDFWGKRWNRLVHGCLKRSVYKPVRSYSSSKGLATISTFLMSGLLHEYCWITLFYSNIYEEKEGMLEDRYVPLYGKQMLFFGWNGILLILEYILVGSSFGSMISWFPQTLPKPLVGMLVCTMALPVSHWFTGDLIALDYFYHMQIGFPRFVIN